MNPSAVKALSRKQWIYTTLGGVCWATFVVKITSHLPGLEFLVYSTIGFVSMYFLWKSLDIYNKPYKSEEQLEDSPVASDSGRRL